MALKCEPIATIVADANNRLANATPDDRWVLLDRWPGQSANSETGEFCFVMHCGVAKLLSQHNSSAILSSRLPKVLDDYRSWFDALRTAGKKIAEPDDVLLTARATAADRYAERMAALFSIRSVTVDPVAADKFCSRLLRNDCVGRSNTVYCVTTKRWLPDQWLAQVADTVYAISVRNKGNVASVLKTRIVDSPRPGQTYLLNDPELSDPAQHQNLVNAGGIDWLLLPTQTDLLSKLKTSPASIATIRTIGEINESDYLIHWTRARVGPWPDQIENEHLDDLIFGSPRSKRNELRSLSRILATQRIVASADLTRHATPVVCFSEVPISQIKTHTVYRKHLQRWDFVPYGVGIRKSVLANQFDCRPVIYGDDKKWQSLTQDQRPYFQVSTSADQKIDWRQEREWRVVGDVDLRRVAVDDGIVFAGDENDLEKLSRLSLFDLIAI